MLSLEKNFKKLDDDTVSSCSAFDMTILNRSKNEDALAWKIKGNADTCQLLVKISGEAQILKIKLIWIPIKRSLMEFFSKNCTLAFKNIQ